MRHIYNVLSEYFSPLEYLVTLGNYLRLFHNHAETFPFFLTTLKYKIIQVVCAYAITIIIECVYELHVYQSIFLM